MLDAATSRALGASPAPELTSEPSATAVSASHSSPARGSDPAARLHQGAWSLVIRMWPSPNANIETARRTPNTLTISRDARRSILMRRGEKMTEIQPFLAVWRTGTAAAPHTAYCFRTSQLVKDPAMNMHVGNNTKLLGSFPTISFRKKRLTVAIHAHFDMECAEDVENLRNRIEETMVRLANDGEAKIGYTLTDI
jgi:hypothetical protein